MTDTSEPWREQGENMGLNDETVRIELYCDRRKKATWGQEAEELGYTSLSKYLRDMIDYGRADQQESAQRRPDSSGRIQDLETEIESLEQRLAEQESASIDPDVVDVELVESLLGEQYQTVEEILDQLTENEDLQSNLKTPVYDALVDLAGDDRAEYQPGHGWRLGGGQ